MSDDQFFGIYFSFCITGKLIKHKKNIRYKEKIVGKTSFADCQHIALATINNVDVLASWNFKHIVNLERIRG